MKPFFQTAFARSFWFALLTACIFPIHAQITSETIGEAEKIIGLTFDSAERDSMQNGLEENLAAYNELRKSELDNSIPPALSFNPVPVGFEFTTRQYPIVWNLPAAMLPEKPSEIAFLPIGQLSYLIRSKQITSTQLTKIYLNRLKKYGPQLECVITLTEDLALKQAANADEEIAAGKYRGPLHGIPYGVKDLLAVEGYLTTWGAAPYQDQKFETTSTVVQRLEEAGAVLVAKLTMGALAWGDVWFGGKTRNPWDINQGSSGSSAGSASATAAGLVGFSIGTETWGSIVSPSTRCGNTGLRPTYGRVSRTGAMALSWSMDKIGPICRNSEDCALVFEAIYGPDGKDQTLIDVPFNYVPEIDVSKLRMGYTKDLFDRGGPFAKEDQQALEVFKKLGAELIPIALPDDVPVSAMSFILNAEAAAAFDDLTRSNRDTMLVRQIKNAWPNAFRTARFVPAVEYIQANRWRYKMIQDLHEKMKSIDVLITPSFVGDQLLMTNLSGHPCVVFPHGFDDGGHPTSMTLVGNLYDEAIILAVARLFQEATDFENKHPQWLK